MPGEFIVHCCLLSHLTISFFLLLVYIFAQFVGATIGAALAYAQYIHAIDLFEGGSGLRTKATASLFVSYPVSKFNFIFS